MNPTFPQKTYTISGLDISSSTERPSRGNRLRAVVAEQLAVRTRRSSRSGKNPALASWLSSILWGSGQIYADSLVTGAYFFIAQVLWLGALVGTLLYSQEIFSFWTSLKMNEISLLYLGLFLSFLFTLLWVVNIFHAYRLAERNGRGKFEGIDSLLFVVFGGGWLPGLSQILNGQPRKALFFFLTPLVSIFNLGISFWAWNFWPLLKDPSAMFFAEASFLSLPVLFCLSAAMGVWSLYDAARVNLYPGIRASIWKRLKFSWNRFTRGSILDKIRMLPRVCLRYALILLVFAMVVHVGWYFIPVKFYSERLTQLSQGLTQKGMTITPHLVSLSAQSVKEWGNAPKSLDAYLAALQKWR